MTFLIDVHHVGGRQTGNETWAANIARELATSPGVEPLAFAATAAGCDEVAALTGRTPRIVSARAIRRVAVDLPRVASSVRAAALLVHYTMPLTRRPCVVVVHDLSPFDPDSTDWLPAAFRARVRASIRRSARSAAALLVPSEFTRQGVIERFGVDPDRVSVAPNAVDPGLAQLIDAVPRSEGRSGTNRVLVVGNVLPRKNLGTVAAAVAALRATGLEIELRVVGRVPDAGREIERDLRHRLGEAVSFTGYVSPAQLAAEYVAADLLAFPSLFEGFGIPVLEAMYAGIPVIVSHAGSLPEVAGDAGLVVPSLDVDGWRAAIGDLLDDAPRRRELVAAGHRRVAEYSWAASAAAALDALRTAGGTTGSTVGTATS
ncbi:MAG TPA: glycosyltransferase family 1 protein [Mycobacteriales bacterium]|nr:glycosyltransferase family 1 protein [Mycobacteriales bacterium]